MSNNNYAFAVAQIRSYENFMLNKNLYDQILAADGEKDVIDILAARGWQMPENGGSVDEVLALEQKNVWELLSGLAENALEMRIFTVKNDYHNLKTVIKAFVGNTEAEGNFMYPADVDTAVLTEAVTEKKYDLLPGGMQAAAQEAYNALASSGDGQTADIIIDRYTLDELLDISSKTDSDLVKKYCELAVESSDIKTAFRGAATGKNDEFFEASLCGTDFLDKKALTRAARKGVEEVLTYLVSSGHQEESSALKSSISEFEKWYENKVLSIMKDANFVTFGIEPLIAYGFKKENEIKNVRIALTCKNMGADRSVTEERMRITDV